MNKWKYNFFKMLSDVYRHKQFRYAFQTFLPWSVSVYQFSKVWKLMTSIRQFSSPWLDPHITNQGDVWAILVILQRLFPHKNTCLNQVLSQNGLKCYFSKTLCCSHHPPMLDVPSSLFLDSLYFYAFDHVERW